MSSPKNVTPGATGKQRKFLPKIRKKFETVPTLGWLFGILAAVLIEMQFSAPLAAVLGLGKIPTLLGLRLIFTKPLLIPSVLLFVGIVYVLPILLVARLTAALMNKISAVLIDKLPQTVSVIIHLALLFLVIHVWSQLNAYRVLMLSFVFIAIIVTLSLNLINGYMGEFSCSHPGFMAVGAYVTSFLTVRLFTNNDFYGDAFLPEFLGPFIFPIILVIGGFAAALASLIVAIPSFRTRGDYLAIISLAFTFIVKSVGENLEVLGGARGLMGQPKYSNLLFIFIWMCLALWVLINYTKSILGKTMNAVRDNETAADAMTINTRKTKVTSFMLAAFWAGIAGGLFAHLMGYINPSTFGIPKLLEVIAMVYLGGLNSVVGSIAGAVGVQLLMEVLRPLNLFKWIVIPTLVIVVMIKRPSGLLAFREIDIKALISPRKKKEKV